MLPVVRVESDVETAYCETCKLQRKATAANVIPESDRIGLQLFVVSFFSRPQNKCETFTNNWDMPCVK